MAQRTRQGLRALIPGLASGFAAVFTAIAAAAQPETELSVSQWAEDHRRVGVESQSPHPGPWKNARAPYLIEPMDACQVGNGVSRVVLTGAAQFGKSEIPLNALGHLIQFDPRGVMVLLPSIEEARTWSRLKWEPTVSATPALASRVLQRKSRSGEGSTTMVKRFRGGSLEIATAGASKGLQMRTIGFLVCEECDQYDTDKDGRVGVGGDAIDAAEKRMLTFGVDAKTILCSTPGFVENSRITREYLASDMRRWFTPCPHCFDFSVLDFKTLDLFEGRPVFSCIGCGGVIEETHKRWMNARGRWIPTFTREKDETSAGDGPGEGEGEGLSPASGAEANPPPPKLIPADEIERWAARDCEGRPRGYHLWQAQSNLSAWITIWEGWQKVQAGQADEKEFTQKVLGEPWAEKVDRPDHEKLYEARGKLYRAEGEVPEWASMVTGSIDVQHNRLEWAVYAWGRGGIGARIAKGVIPKNPLDWATWADVATLVESKFKGPAYIPRVADYWGIDSGGNATDNVYAFVLGRQHLSTGAVLSLKGASHDKGEHPAIQVGNRVKVKRKGVTIGTVRNYLVGTHGMKSRVYFGLAQGVLSAETKQLERRALLYGREATKQDFKQLTAEHIVRDDPREKGVWQKPQGVANEQLDLAVYCLALAINEGLDRLDDAQWAERHAARAPDLVEQQLTPLERLMKPADDGETQQPKLVAPPAEAHGRQGLTEDQRAAIRRMGQQSQGDA